MADHGRANFGAIKRLLNRLSRLTRLARGIDLGVPSNRVVVAGSLAAGAAAAGLALVRGTGAGSAPAAAIQAGLSIFLAWAIARELDPDSPRSALLAMPAAGAILFTGRPYLAGVLGVLLIARIALRSTGGFPTLLDLIFLAALAASLARTVPGVPVALVLALALAVNASGGPIAGPVPQPTTHEPGPGRSRAGAIVVIVFAAVSAWYFGSLKLSWRVPDAAQWAVLVLAAGACLMLRIGHPVSRDDRNRATLLRTKLVYGTWMSVLAGVLTVAWIGGPAVPALSGLWAALLGVALTQRWPKTQ